MSRLGLGGGMSGFTVGASARFAKSWSKLANIAAFAVSDSYRITPSTKFPPAASRRRPASAAARLVSMVRFSIRPAKTAVKSQLPRDDMPMVDSP